MVSSKIKRDPTRDNNEKCIGRKVHWHQNKIPYMDNSMKQNKPHTMEKFNPRVICGGALAILNIE